MSIRARSGSIGISQAGIKVIMLDIYAERTRGAIDVRRVSLIIVVFGVACACLAILRPLLSVITWAAILAYVSWPLYRRIRRPLGRLDSVAALLMTAMLTCVVILPVLWLVAMVSTEIIAAHRTFASYLAGTPSVLPESVRSIPWLGDQLQEQLGRLAGEPNGLDAQIADWIQSFASELAGLAGGVGRSIGKLFLVMLTVFFLYRDGHGLLGQCRVLVTKVFADRLDSYLAAAGAMTRAVLYGFLATAFAQGLIAGIGYAILGIRGSVLLGALTGVLSVVPVLGTAIVWGSVSAYLFVTGYVVKGIILVAWGLLLVHPTDNVLRPLLISGATDVPFIIVMFGVIGGVAAFGLVGIFVGPVILAVGLAMWRNWAAGEISCP
jgi:predicted PurR-regulated permease PerM